LKVWRCVLGSLSDAKLGYRRRPSGELEYAGVRPGPCWHVHGWFPREITEFVDGVAVRVTLWKRRWKRKGTTETCHSRPPDDLGPIRVGAAVLVLKLWAWLTARGGLCSYDEVHPSLRRPGVRRTLQRWLDRALPKAQQTQQVLRRAVLERFGTRPVEMHFPGGLSPPEGLLGRPWQDREAVVTLWRGFALLLGGADVLGVPLIALLVEARRSMEEPSTFLI